METKRQRTRILLRAAIGGTGQKVSLPNHHLLELSDGSETSDSFAKESEMITSLNGSGMHYDHTSVGVSSNGTLPVVQSSPIMKHTAEVPEIVTSFSAPIRINSEVNPDPSVPRLLPQVPPPTTIPPYTPETHPNADPPLVPIPTLETYPYSSSSLSLNEADGPAVADTDLYTTAHSTSFPLTGTEEGMITRVHPRATIPKQNAQFLTHPQTTKKQKATSKSEPKLHKKRRKASLALKISVSNSSTNSSTASPRSLHNDGTQEVTHPIKAHRTKPPRNKPPRSSRLKRGKNQVHPESQQVPNPDLVNLVNGTSAVTRSLSPTTTTSVTSRQSSLFETGRSSVSMLTPLLTSSLRMNSVSDGRWDFSGESQLESFFPDRHIRIYIVTWNMQEKKVSEYV